MERTNILLKAVKEIDKRVSAISNLQRDVYGVKSELLDMLLGDKKRKNREEYGLVIKAELEKKIQKAKEKENPRIKYIENLENILADIEKRIEGNKINNERKQILDLDKKQGFNSEMIKEITDSMIEHAATDDHIEEGSLYKKLSKKNCYTEDIARLLKYRSDHVTDTNQRKNIESLIEKLLLQQKKLAKTKEKNGTTAKVLMTLGVLISLSLIFKGGWELSKQQEQFAGMKGKKIEEVKTPFPEMTIVSLEKLQRTISDTLLQDGVTYEELVLSVGGTINQETKKEILDFLYAGNIMGLQEYLCMKEDSKYKNNRATGYIDKNTMDLLEGGWYGMRGEEILQNDSISEDVKDKYRELIEGTMDNNGENYLVESKISMSSYLFDTEYRLIDFQPIIVGKDLGKDQEYVPYAWFYEQGVKKYYKDHCPKELNNNTPEGLFAIEGIDNIIEEDYRVEVEGKKEAITLDPIMLTTKGLKYDLKKIKMRLHPPFLPSDDEERYIKALETPTIADNNQSHGCISVKNFGRIRDNLKIDQKNGSRIYITEYNKYKNQTQKKTIYTTKSICQNYKQKYFPTKRGKY